MLKLARVAAVFASLLIGTVAAGCSSETGPSEGVTDDHLGESEAPLARFKPYMTTLRSTLESGQSNEQIANTLLSSGRPASFSLQALCRLYSDADPKFKEIRDDFKRLEDGIGQYDKWASIYNAAVSAHNDQATLDRLKGQRDTALTTFTQMLTDRKFLVPAGQTSRMQEVQAFLEGFDWKTRKDDRALILKALGKELEDLEETHYDMTILEYGDGVHELRRDLRWVLIEQLSLNGMIVGNEASCSIEAYKTTPNDGRYGALRSSATEPDPCKIDACLIYQAAKTVSDIGDIKDQAETEVNIGNQAEADKVPERLVAPAKAIYDGITTNQLFATYRAQLKACRDAL
jgi:hypothetical protein